MDRKKPEKNILDQFDGKSREEVLLLWDKARRREPLHGAVSQTDLQTEWKRLQKRIGPPRPTLHIHPARLRASAAKTYAFIASLAAMLLGGFLMWYLFVPVSIEAPRGSYSTFTWDDGVRAEINSGSTISWNRSFTNGHRNLRLHGEAYFEVPPGGKPFTVETQTARVEVMGTRFNVRSWPGDPTGRTTLTLIDGRVRMASLLEPQAQVMLQPGYSTHIDLHHTAPQEPQPVNIEQALAWRNHGFFFSAIPMSEVAAELERRFDSEIIIGNEQLGSHELTIYLPRPGDLETIIETICFVTGCRFTQEEGRIHLF